jgi:hypothetical protein
MFFVIIWAVFCAGKKELEKKQNIATAKLISSS